MSRNGGGYDNPWEGTGLDGPPTRPKSVGSESLPIEAHDAERQLLAEIFSIGGENLALEAIDVVKPEWFLDPRNQMIFEAGRRIIERNGEVSLLTMNDELGKDVGKVGGSTALINLLSLYDGSSWKELAKIIQSKWEARTAIKTLERVKRSIESDGAVLGHLNGLGELLGALAPRQSTIVDHADLLDLASTGIPLLPDDKARNLPYFGVSFLDYELNATSRRFGVIAAKTSAGKSSMAYQICMESACHGKRVLLVSLESDREEVSAALAANLSHMNRSMILRHGTGGFDDERLAAVKMNVHGYYASSGSTWEAIDRTIRAEHKRNPFRVVIVDYFTLLQPPEYKGRNLANLYGEISKAGKRLAQELECSVIFLSQFNRGVEDGQEPHLENLRETGQLEQDADWVLLLWSRPDDELDGTRIVFAKGAKNRGGKRNFKGKMTFYPAESRFVENFSETEPPKITKKIRA